MGHLAISTTPWGLIYSRARVSSFEGIIKTHFSQGGIVPANQPDQVHELFQAAFNARDTAAVLALYEETALFVTGPGPTVVTGGGTIRPALEHLEPLKAKRAAIPALGAYLM